MKKHLSTVVLVGILMIGLFLLFYPSISDYWNSKHQSQAIISYSEQVAKLAEDHYDVLWSSALKYNESLLERSNEYYLSEEDKKMYEDLLNLDGSGVMGYIEIPSIGVSLPIYHGTNESVLQIAVGHIEWTSLPVGGESSHCVLSGHRGLPSAKLFTDLDQLATGDLFMFRVLDEVLTYEVDQILIVEPEDTDALQIESGKDLCTLVTCTPYGINSHRLLVRGHRVDNVDAAMNVRITSDAVPIDSMIVAVYIGVPLILLVWGLSMLPKSGKNRR